MGLTQSFMRPPKQLYTRPRRKKIIKDRVDQNNQIPPTPNSSPNLKSSDELLLGYVKLQELKLN